MKAFKVASALKRRVPWQAKLAAKVVLSRVPIPYAAWKTIAAFEHGEMNLPTYAYNVFQRHWDRFVSQRKNTNGFVVLELGPGDSLFSAVIAKAFGASAVYLVDVGPFANRDLKIYRDMIQFLDDMGFAIPECAQAESFDALLSSCSAKYLTDGVASLGQIPSGSIDFIWSNAVLEHVRRHEFSHLLQELRRVQATDGLSSHRIDLKDHLGGALNNLRFSHSVWESDFMAESGFYTNRIRYSEMVALFRAARFLPEVTNLDRWIELPTPRNKLAEPFSRISFEDLSVSGFDVTLH